MNITTEQINELALKAQIDLGYVNDEADRTDNIWNLIAVFYNKINELERIHGNNYNDEMAFLLRCEKKIEYAARAFNPNVQDFEALANHTLQQAVKDFYNRKSGYKKLHDSYEYITSDGEDGEKSPHYIEDPKENIEGNIVSEEFRSSLIDEYGTDDKRHFILNRWSEEGKTIKNTELAREMIEFFGGSENTHVQFIKRFRSDLRKGIDKTTIMQ